MKTISDKQHAILVNKSEFVDNSLKWVKDILDEYNLYDVKMVTIPKWRITMMHKIITDAIYKHASIVALTKAMNARTLIQANPDGEED